jgi:hypothetical protein
MELVVAGIKLQATCRRGVKKSRQGEEGGWQHLFHLFTDVAAMSTSKHTVLPPTVVWYLE